MQQYEKIGNVEQLFRTTFENGWSVSVTFDECANDYMYDLQINLGEFYHYESTNNPNEIFKSIARVQNYDTEEV